MKLFDGPLGRALAFRRNQSLRVSVTNVVNGEHVVQKLCAARMDQGQIAVLTTLTDHYAICVMGPAENALLDRRKRA